MTRFERFAKKYLVSESGCWIWTAGKWRGGYGQFNWTPGKQSMGAHRAAFLLHVGPIPDGLLVCHSCDVPACVNPSHLFLGSCSDNHKDRNEKGRQAKMEQHGRAKLSVKKAEEIRFLYSLGTYSHRRLGRAYSVAHTQIGRVLRDERWA